jgi:NAD(P)-dependent dehydrogenase (short-subunit alcohol dehydrogenase family)
VIERHLAVNFLGLLRVTHAFLPLLRRSKVGRRQQPVLGRARCLAGHTFLFHFEVAAFNMTQSLRALLASQAVTVHAVVLGPIDTDMNRGFEILKASPDSAAVGIFDGLEKGEEDIFPDPASQSIAASWHTGVPKPLERQFAAFVPGSAPKIA